MEKTYNPQQLEKKWYGIWEKNGYFIPRETGKPYCIMIPPPNVTGSLHMGHGFQISLMDALIRYHRMLGDKTLWQGGTDHAGISTQMVVERQIAKEGKTRHDLGRETFVERVWEWKNTSDNTISSQLRRMGASVDWTRERFTLDAEVSKAVIEVFVRLYEEGLIYRGKKLVNWDPNFLTAISDLEVISNEEKGYLWHLRYPLSDDRGYVIVATTRPETLLGDVAVAVHPEDKRYQHLIGKYVKLPLTDRIIPIIADEFVDPEFGSGCVKITPAHDFNDYEVGQRHALPLINIFTPNAHLNENVPPQYRGLERFEARTKIVADLENANLIEKTEAHTLKIPRNDRGATIIEPYLTDQWFVKMTELAAPAIKAVEEGLIRFVPENWTKTYFQWMHNLQDWCISRQLWWGHRIPAWYDNQDTIYVGRDEAEVRKKYQLNPEIQLKQDDDVLDTWFSSALWPFATLGWPDPTPEFKTFYPTNVLVTGFDIIFFWVARMIMMGLKFTGKVPFEEVYITGLIRDSEGQKMSKTKGNVLDPIDLIDGIDLESLLQKRTQGLIQSHMTQKIEKATRKEFSEGIPAFGTDALRFTYCALATTGRDIRFDLGRLEGYRNFCNKIWNAARYVFMTFERLEYKFPQHPIEFSLIDTWILSRLQVCIGMVTQHFTHYRFDLAAQTLHEFTWHEFCDWYLELTKPALLASTLPLTLSSTQVKERDGTCFMLVHVLENMLRLLHPLMPFITEEIWQQLRPYTLNESETIMQAPYPIAELSHHFYPQEIELAQPLIEKLSHPEKTQEIVNEIEWLKQIITAIRSIRSEMNISPNQLVKLLVRKYQSLDEEHLKKYELFLIALLKLEAEITFLDDNAYLPPTATAIVGHLELLIPLAGLIDKKAELTRLNKERDKLLQEKLRAQKKLEDENYLTKAPMAIVEKEQRRLQELTELLAKLGDKVEQLLKI